MHPQGKHKSTTFSSSSFTYNFQHYQRQNKTSKATTMKAFYSFPLIFLPSLVSAIPSDLAAVELDKKACTPFINPLTNANGCCDTVSTELFWVNILLGTGVCCPIGQVLDGFNCVAPPPAASHLLARLSVPTKPALTWVSSMDTATSSSV